MRKHPNTETRNRDVSVVYVVTMVTHEAEAQCVSAVMSKP